jgi:threonine dehydrogenase-like Zn-dependent dehydrogenase
VSANTDLAEIFSSYVIGGAYPYLIVKRGGDFVGMLRAAEVRKVERGTRTRTRARDILLPREYLVTVDPAATCQQADHLMASRGADHAYVMSGSGPIGIVYRQDIEAYRKRQAGIRAALESGMT